MNQAIDALDDAIICTVTYRQYRKTASGLVKIGDRFTSKFFENLRLTAKALGEIRHRHKICFWVDKVLTKNAGNATNKSWASTGLMPYLLFDNLLVDSEVSDYESRFWIVTEQLAAATGFGTFTLNPNLIEVGQWIQVGELYMRLGGLHSIKRSIQSICRDLLNVESAGFGLSYEKDRTDLINFSINYLSTKDVGINAELFGADISQGSRLTIKEAANIVSRMQYFDQERIFTVFRHMMMPTRETSRDQGCWQGTREWLPPVVAERIHHLSNIADLTKEIANFTAWEIWKAGEDDIFAVGVFSLDSQTYQSMVVRLKDSTCDPENHVISSQRLWPCSSTVHRGRSREVIVAWLRQTDGGSLLPSLTRIGTLEGRDVKWTGVRSNDERSNYQTILLTA